MIPRRAAAVLLLWAAAGTALPASSGPRPRPPLDAARLEIALQRLEVVGGVLYIAAHPDDENTAFLAWARGGKMLRATYLSVTRGDGGQNLIGTEQGPLIGLLRTQELLAAREVDGAEQRFTRASDFGFSKTSAETLALWDREAVLGDIVWAIRKLRPDVMVTRFPKVDPETHGHHTSSAILAEEAFHAAGDASRFLEQLGSVEVWQPRRLFWNNWRPKLEGRTPEMPALVTLDLGGYSPLLGRAWTEIAAESRSMHKSQGFGSAERRGTILNYFELLAGEPLPPGANDLCAGLDLTWSRVPGGERAGKLLADAHAAFRPDHPEAVVPGLARALAELDRLPRSPWVENKRVELLEVVRSAAGLWLEAVADRSEVSPGGTLEVTTAVLNRSDLPLTLEAIDIAHKTALPDLGPEPLVANRPTTARWSVAIPADAPLTHPFWLGPDGQPDPARASIPALRGLPEAPPALVARFTLALAGPAPTRLVFEQPVAFRWTDPVEGERWRPLAIVPALALELDSRMYVFADARPKVVRVKVTSHAGAERGPVHGLVRLVLPGGYRAEPASAPFELAPTEDETRVSFTVTPGASGTFTLGAVAESSGHTFDRRVVRIEHAHVPVQTLTPEAQARLLRVDLAGPRPRTGYVMGSGDEVPDALLQAGYPVELLDDQTLESGDLARFDSIVTGIRAWNTREQLKPAAKRLLAWVADGGTLLVQYSTNRGLVTDAIGPYPFEISRDRVTVEDAPVRLTAPEHPLLTWPHRIGEADFAGWIQERGLYFAGKSDPRYQTVLASADPGESDKTGALLYARHGKGVFLYTGLAFFRELPAGVPGAYRLFANLLAGGSTARP